MIVTPIHTDPITVQDTNLTALLDRYIDHMDERSVLAITSKIVALSEGSVVPLGESNKNELAMKEAELFIPPQQNPYQKVVSIKNHTLIISAGVDSRNTDGYFVLHPNDSFQTAIEVWKYLRERFHLTECGVIITDSHSTPLRKGVTGISLGYCGFAGVYAPVGQHDIFGNTLSGPINTADALAASAVAVMGETSEQTPLAVIEDIPVIQWATKPPTSEELSANYFSIEDDVFMPLLTAAPWKKGSQSR